MVCCHVIPTKWRSYRDHRLIDVTSPDVYLAVRSCTVDHVDKRFCSVLICTPAFVDVQPTIPVFLRRPTVYNLRRGIQSSQGNSLRANPLSRLIWQRLQQQQQQQQV